ncbi:S1C family serine protease [Ammoniphilus sp. YIM 78166]|uniref:S1C family serine protease n=1 Tax=Ammoniphilus sp. YIM 78166 TaxID=1644106 RepID=UPI001432169C|nr:trypsin-like peptidase domain-containing protein [Ammoniphilus sp. YIM 78166]
MHHRLIVNKRSTLSHPVNYVVRIVDRVKNSVVSIQSFRSTPGGSDQPENIGTGFIIHPDGYFLTSEHVIGSSPYVRIRFIDGREYTVKRVWADRKRDLCIVKSHTLSRFSPLPLGSSSQSKLGEIVIAVGNPLDLGQSITAGIISGKKRSIRTEDASYQDLLQTDCAINPGNSGGPLLNIKGEVIAVNSFIAQDYQRIGFAIGIDGIKKVLSKIKI